MTTKLTLTMNNIVIGRAKEYARSRNTSVSAIVEDFLDRISNQNRPFVSLPLYSPLVDSMTGIVPDDGRDYKELLDEARAERFARKGINLG